VLPIPPLTLSLLKARVFHWSLINRKDGTIVSMLLLSNPSNDFDDGWGAMYINRALCAHPDHDDA